MKRLIPLLIVLSSWSLFFFETDCVGQCKCGGQKDVTIIYERIGWEICPFFAHSMKDLIKHKGYNDKEYLTIFAKNFSMPNEQIASDLFFSKDFSCVILIEEGERIDTIGFQRRNLDTFIYNGTIMSDTTFIKYVFNYLCGIDELFKASYESEPDLRLRISHEQNKE